MNIKYPLGIFLAALCGLAACKKSANPNNGPKVTDVYVVGVSADAVNSYNNIATIWKNNVATQLTTNHKPSSAVSVTVAGTDVYVAGYSQPTYNNFASFATYWKNGVSVLLGDSLSNIGSNATGIVIQNNNIYISGYIYGQNGKPQAAYWKNGVATILSTDSRGSEGNAIVVNGTDVYVAGELNNTAVYWKNGILNILPYNTPYDFASGIAVNSNNIYISGNSNYTGFNATGLLWNNGQATEFADSSYTAAVTLQGNDVYATGGVLNQTGLYLKVAYWKNGVVTTLTDGTFSATGYAIAVSGTDVYVAGTYMGISSPNLSNGTAVYWKNGVAVPLGNNRTDALGIAVVVH